MRILFLANELLTMCGVSKHLFYILKDLKRNHSENEYFVICGGGDALEKFRSIGIPVIVNKNLFHKPRAIKEHLLALYFVNYFVKKNNIELIHSHHHYLAGIAEKIKIFNSVKTIMTNHGILQKQGLLNHYSSDNIIVLNESIEAFLYEKFQSRKNIFLLSHGFDVPLTNQKIQSKRTRILLASRVVKEKGTDIFLDALLLIERRIIEKLDIKIAGSGSCLEESKIFVNKYKLPVKFLGKVKDVNALMKDNDILVFPTRARYEGLPTVIVEAGLQGNIILSSNFIHHETFLKDNVNSIIFKIDDSKELSNKLLDIITNISKYSRVREKVFTDFKNRFNIKENNKKLVSIYEKIIEG